MIRNIAAITVIALVFIFNSAYLDNSKGLKEPHEIDPPFMGYETAWVDSVFETLTPDERIAQLFLVQVYSNQAKTHVDNIAKLVKEQKVGGLVFFQGGPVRQANLNNYFQSVSKVPLLMAMDAEYGLGMRLDSTISFPKQITLGAIEDVQLIYEMGVEIARQFKRIGMHINFAPVVDVNINPKNPVIGNRSFGENPENVAQKGFAYMLGLQDNHILAVAKHFPGHGDTDSDSHHTLPVINQTKERLDSVELYPFKRLITGGLGGIMAAHLSIPALDSTPDLASSLSRAIVTDLLRDSLGFKGLIITDALGMRGVCNYYEPGKADVKALLAGNDMLLMSKDVPLAISEINKAIEDSLISRKEIDQRCKKVLSLKHWVGLNREKYVDTDSLYEDLNTNEAKYLKQKLIEASIGVLENKNNLLPLKRIDTLQIASFSIGTGKENVFQNTMDLYTQVQHFGIEQHGSFNVLNILIDSLSKYELVIVGVHNKSEWSSELSDETVEFVQQLSSRTNVILDLFSSPYSLNEFSDLSGVQAIVASNTNNKASQSLSAQLLFGGVESKGKMPVAVAGYNANHGLSTGKPIRLKYSVPEETGIEPDCLTTIDSIVYDAIKKGAMPGCQVLAAKDGIVFYYKSFGYHTYSKKRPVKNTDIYDLASITKVAATTLSLMKLTDQKKFDTKKKLSDYLPMLDSTNKKNLKCIDVLTHQAKLEPWIPFYLHTLTNKYSYPFVLDKEYYSKHYSDKYSVQVADNMYIIPTYKDTLLKEIIESGLLKKKRYKYSDLGFYLFREIIEKQTKQPLDQYVTDNFYAPLCANTLGFNPLKKFLKDQIVPTENDLRYRGQLIRGYVHDEGAAMLGGVSGHAGLFANANDLAKLMQMLLQNGSYGGKQFISPGTIQLYTSCPFCKSHKSRRNRRGLGFDKPPVNSKGKSAISWLSEKSFGHTGFTGTMIWVDPSTNIVYIFLSNRISPDAENRKFIEMGVRRNIQEVFYNCLL